MDRGGLLGTREIALGEGAGALVVNKMDLLDDPNALLPEMDELHARHDFAGIFPISALRQKNLDRLETFVREHLPEGYHLFPEGQITNRTERFLAAELIERKSFASWGMSCRIRQRLKSRRFIPIIGVSYISMRSFLWNATDKSE